jgi:formiminoglutamate deiminase
MSDLEIPGFANVHAHSFQRALRGAVQRRDPSRTDSFWTWRETMYELAGRLTAAEFEAVARGAYAECLEAGYTAVGEFHYLHRLAGADSDDPLESSRVLLRAAAQTGIRINLLWTVYHQGGFGKALEPRQRPFRTDDLGEVERALDHLQGHVDGERAQVGLAIHSVRAVPREWFGPLAELARTRGLMLHAHVSEQVTEVEACRRATGLSPVGLLASEGALGDRCVAIHATWLDDEDVTALADSGTHVCVCPTTEGDLGDGFAPTARLAAAGVPISIGSDSHAVIDPFAELRTLEYEARASTGTRCVLVDDEGLVAPALMAIGGPNGYRALGLASNGDRVLIDSDARALSGVGDRLGALLTAGHPGLVRRVEVDGEVLVESGRHVSC